MGGGTVTTNDGVSLAYDKHGSTGPTIVLIHGWSSSRRYFDLNVQALSKECLVYALDLRFHGESDRPTWGHHIARLSADVRDFLTTLDLKDVTLVGTSMGASIIWSYIELYGEDRIAKAVFVDQAALQNRADDWTIGSLGCYDVETLSNLQNALRKDMKAFAKGNAECCLTLEIGKETDDLLESETLKCNPEDLAKLMADHTQLDWRSILTRISIPCLNTLGGTSGVFPVEGCMHVGETIKDCVNVVFEKANHWLYIEMPTDFNNLVLDFVKNGNEGRPKTSKV